jgi:head-tail adaptor
MSFDSLLNTTCEVQKRTLAQDATGQPIETWVMQSTGVRCRLNPISGGEKQGSNQLLGSATHTLFVKTNILPDTGEYRVLIDSVTYNVLLNKNAGGHNHHFEFLLEIIK